MAKANITTPDGTTINLEGTSDEIATLVTKFGLMSKAVAPIALAAAVPAAVKSAPAKTRAKSGGRSKGIAAVLSEMIGDGHFRKPKLLGDLRTELEQAGHFYRRQDVGTALLRAVKAKQLRRIKQDGKWAYVG